MKLQIANPSCRLPQLREVLKTSSHLSLPPHSILETSTDFQIVFNLFGAAHSLLHVSISDDARRLHVVGTKRFHDLVAEFLWVFELPQTANTAEIRIANRQDVHMIHIPKTTDTQWHSKQMTLGFANRSDVA